MILLTGDNSFAIDRMLTAIKKEFNGEAETYDGGSLEVRQLPDLLMGGTLFADKRLVIIKNASLNKSLWADFVKWLDRTSDDVSLVLVEPTLDKRTKTTKHVLKTATVHEFKSWTDRDRSAAEQWAITEMEQLGGVLDKKSTQHLVARLGVDQWLLYGALYKLSVLDSVTPQVIDDTVEPTLSENVFALFELALKGDTAGVARIIHALSLTEDSYRLFGLLSGQAFHIAALATTTKTSAEVASDVKAHPFALSKLATPAKRLGASGARQIVLAFAQADADMKLSVADHWLLIERALMHVARLSNR